MLAEATYVSKLGKRKNNSLLFVTTIISFSFISLRFISISLPPLDRGIKPKPHSHLILSFKTVAEHQPGVNRPGNFTNSAHARNKRDFIQQQPSRPQRLSSLQEIYHPRLFHLQYHCLISSNKRNSNYLVQKYPRGTYLFLQTNARWPIRPVRMMAVTCLRRLRGSAMPWGVSYEQALARSGEGRILFLV